MEPPSFNYGEYQIITQKIHIKRLFRSSFCNIIVQVFFIKLYQYRKKNKEYKYKIFIPHLKEWGFYFIIDFERINTQSGNLSDLNRELVNS